MPTSLAGKTLFVTGASRGIGLSIALRAARDGANIVVAAKTDSPHPVLPGTIHTAASEIEAAGGRALPLIVDVRDEAMVEAAVAKAVTTFGGIDALVNNASAISLTGTLETPMKRFDLMHQINTRGTFLCSQKCLPHLKAAAARDREGIGGRILNISPPLSVDAKWFAPHVAYTMAKFGMSLCVLGMAREFQPDGVAVNALWPATAIDTEAIRLIMGEEARRRSRLPTIMGDAAHRVLTMPRSRTGEFLIDEEVLREAGERDFGRYRHVGVGEDDLVRDFFV